MDQDESSENQLVKLESPERIHSENSDDEAEHDQDASIKCSYCSRTFIRKSGYKRHLQTHLQEPIKCEYCGRVCPKKSVLIKHLRTHTGEKPFKCNICRLQFATKPSLDYHIAVHNGERPFVCSECGKSFIQNSHLTRHLRVHTGEKPYCCDHCDMRFSRHGSLQVHLRRHTGEALFSCTHCDRKFIDQSTFKYHLRKLSGQKPYICLFCGQAFISSSHVRKHERVHLNKKTRDAKQKYLKYEVDESNPIQDKFSDVGEEKLNRRCRAAKVRTTSRNYCCSFCPMKFIRRGALQSHLTFHEAQLKVKEKDLYTTSSSALIKHENFESILSDADEKPEHLNMSSDSTANSSDDDDLINRTFDTIENNGMFYQLEDEKFKCSDNNEFNSNVLRSGNRKNPFPKKLRRTKKQVKNPVNLEATDV